MLVVVGGDGRGAVEHFLTTAGDAVAFVAPAAAAVGAAVLLMLLRSRAALLRVIRAFFAHAFRSKHVYQVPGMPGDGNFGL